ncbi:histone deacetylase HDT1-like isoform X2 [Aristolochia californica]|uniref:histone deacetylase HDT1-like isoform X2 n=1 Tax=Aristolochia californica TaxID=171875 RepID=UPI0035DAFF36
MEFWGVEVKPGESVKYDPGSEKYVHLSQAAIGEVKKDKTSDVLISVKVDDQKVVLGTLAPGRCPQISFDVVFNKEFELSHNGKSSVYFCGYKTLLQDDESLEFSDSDEDSEDDQLAPLALNGKPDGKVAEPKLTIEKANAAKPESSVTKAKGKVAEPAKAEKAKEDEDEDDDDDDESEEDESGSDEDMVEAGDESDDDEDEEDEDSSEEEETPQKVEIEKKRPQESATKTPVPAKKAKLVTPPGADGKKTTHTSTPYPKKTAAKTSAEGDKSKQQTPKSAGQFACKPCNRTFNSENALQSHNKAKHS